MPAQNAAAEVYDCAGSSTLRVTVKARFTVKNAARVSVFSSAWSARRRAEIGLPSGENSRVADHSLQHSSAAVAHPADDDDP